MSAPGDAPVVLIVDDTAANRRLLTAVFRAEGMNPVAVDSGAAAIAEAAARPPSVVLLDLHMPGMDGLATLARLRETVPGVPVVMLTAHGDVASAVEAIKLGAYDFLTRPVGNDKLVLTVQRALERQRLVGEVAELRRRLVAKESLAQQMGPSAQVARIAREVEQVAETSLTVLVVGETGTGKELVARAVHAASGRAGRAFVALDCGALPDTLLESELFGYERGAFTGADRRKEGYLELAAGGTLFLDEVANLTAVTQAKLLRVLQERQVTPLGATRPIAVDVRVIAATNEALDGRARDGRFRQDLFYRLSEFVIQLPPLRDRREDIPALAQRFLEEACVEWRRQVVGFAPAALRRLDAHDWPGNVRELRNVVRRAVLAAAEPEVGEDEVAQLLGGGTAERLAPPAAPVASREPLPPGASLKDIAERAAGEAERVAIVEALRAAGGNKSQAARALKVDFKTLTAKMKRLGVES